MTNLRGAPWLLGVCLTRVLLYANFMVYAACLPIVQQAWTMSATQAGSIASGFMIGYALSLVAFSALADRLGARRMVLWSAWLSAASALLFGLFARSYSSALILYTLAASTQGGIYTPLIMVFSDRYSPDQRGGAVGWLIGSTSVGYAFSLLVTGLALIRGDYRLAFIVTGALPLLGAAGLSWVLRATPNLRHPRQRGLRLLTILRGNADARRLLLGYTAHAWELLGMWAWIPAFLAASLVLSGSVTLEAAKYSAYLAATLHLLGAVAAATMGRLSDQVGRRRTLIALAGTSAALSLVIGWLIAWPIYLLVFLGLLYAFTAVGDSPVLSTALTEVVEPGYLGDVLALRSLLGFGAGAVAPLAFGAILDLTSVGQHSAQGWGWAFMALGVGGVIAALCAWLLRLLPAEGARSDNPRAVVSSRGAGHP